MKKYFLSAAAALGLFATAANAADLPSRAAPPAPAPVYVAPVFTWAGWYVGGQVGWIQGRDRVSITPFGISQTFKDSSVIGGLYTGYNWQFNSLVLGVEADANLHGISKTVTSFGGFAFAPGDSVRARSNYEAALVGKIGFAFDHALIYALAGGTMTNLDVRYNLFNTFGVNQSNDDTLFGWTVGLGAAYAFNNNWSARIEYRYSDFGSKTDTLIGGQLARVPLSIKHRYKTQRIMLGLTYTFNDPARPIAAKY